MWMTFRTMTTSPSQLVKPDGRKQALHLRVEREHYSNVDFTETGSVLMSHCPRNVASFMCVSGSSDHQFCQLGARWTLF